MNRRFLIIFIAILAGFLWSYFNHSQRGRTSTLTEEEFTQAFADAVKAAEPNAKIKKIDHLQVDFELPKSSSVTSNLDNAWAEYNRNPEHKSEIINRYVRTLIDTIGSMSDKSPPQIDKLLPLIKDDKYIHDTREFGFVAEPFVSDLHICYAFEEPRGFRFLTKDEAQKLGSEKLRAAAIENLRRKLPEVKDHSQGPIHMLTAGGNLEASILLMDEVWDKQAKEMKGDIVVAVPSRDILIFTSSESPEGIQILRTSIQKITAGGDHLISENLLIRKDGKWQKFGR